MKRILITGASSGIGMHLAKTYLDMGWQVIACGRSLEKLQAGLSAHKAAQAQLQYAVFDVDDASATIATLKAFDGLDVAVLNAGVCEYIDDAQVFDSALFERVIKTNVLGTGYCLEGCLPNIKQGGQLAIVSSSVTLLPLTRAEAYGASKAALDYLTRTLSIDLAPKKIGVSLIHPGFVDTPLTERNTFPMPGIINSEDACQHIIKGIANRKQEIVFPKIFYWMLKLLSTLPRSLWRRIAIRMIHIKPHA